MVFLTITTLTGLETFGLVCLILVCFGLPAQLIIDAYKKPQKIKKGEKRELAINKTSYWDYLIVVLPVWLLLINLFSVDYSDRRLSMIVLGVGYSGLILSSYNRRIDILKINLALFIISAVISIAAIPIMFFANPNVTYIKEMSFLYAPLTTYCYLMGGRYVIKQITGTYPITLDKYYRVGFFNTRYNRNTNYWDFIWTMFNIFIYFGILILFYNLKSHSGT
jgi:hypothetical protein